MEKKLKSKLDTIVSKHKQLFLMNKSKPKDLLTMKSDFEQSPNFAEKLTDELINIGNDYLTDNNIDDTSELENYIKIQLKDFYEFCVTSQ